VKVPGHLSELGASDDYDIDPGFAMVLGANWPGIPVRTHYIERLAERWNTCADVYLRNRHRMILVRYEEFDAAKESSIERLARALGLSPRHDIARKVDVQYQPRGNRNVTWGEFYGANLARIERVCRSRMKRLGYP
jgi:hypothetical protein